MTDRLDDKDYVDLYCALRSRPDLELEKLLDQTAVKFGVKGVRYILSGRFLQPLPPWDVLSMRRQLDKEDVVRFYSQHAKAWIARSKEGL